ncbi:MAG TPA: cardiolipin synthase [Polyangiaceae bacterium]|jgi:cardiolipin synthase|nr:cardiolipin synthase [Polyangiaceae bacterium]
MDYLIHLVLGEGRLQWYGPLTVVSQIVALMTIPSVLLQRQGQPRAALAWLLMMFALPAFGVVAWWLIGRTSMVRKRRKRAARARAFAERYGPVHSEACAAFDGLLPPRALGDSIFTSHGNGVELLFDGPSAFPAMERAIAGAKRSVHVMFYIFHDDETGRRFRDLLVERARAGVKVRVLIDAWGTPRFTGKFSKPLRDAGASVAAFLPSHFMPLLAPRFNFANHRKLVVVDDRIGFLGGMNVGDEYALHWRDVMARLEGPAARALDHIFLDDWYFASKEDVPLPDRHPISKPGSTDCAVVVSGPDRASYIHDAYFILFTRAVKRIWIVTPYFIPTDALATALTTAAGRGVDVRVLLPSTSDVSVVKHAARSFYSDLMTAGVNIYEYQGPMLHAKAFLVDDDVSTVGSSNVDTRSFKLNFEVGCFLADVATSQRMSDWYEELLSNSHKVTLAEIRGRSTGAKLLESAAHLFSPML